MSHGGVRSFEGFFIEGLCLMLGPGRGAEDAGDARAPVHVAGQGPGSDDIELFRVGGAASPEPPRGEDAARRGHAGGGATLSARSIVRQLRLR